MLRAFSHSTLSSFCRTAYIVRQVAKAGLRLLLNRVQLDSNNTTRYLDCPCAKLEANLNYLTVALDKRL